MSHIDSYFRISRSDSTIAREVTGGLTTFATMSYIIFVQPTVLAATGMPFGGVLVATCVSAAFASILMGLFANYPVALAPGMGQNFLFAFTICGPAEYGGMGFSWQAGLAIVFIAGALFVALSLTSAREQVMNVLPDCLKHAIGPAIGLFIAFVGLQWGGLIAPSDATMTTLGNLSSGPALVTFAGLAVMVTMHARGLSGGILLGIVVSTGLALALNVIPFEMKPVNISMDTAFQLSFTELFERWDQALIAIAIFFFLILFDTVGTLVGVAHQAGLNRADGSLPRAGRAFLSDAIGSCFGALMGASAVTSYIESASGVAAGARTGLAAVVAGVAFIAAIALAPIVQFTGYDAGPAHYGVDPLSPHILMYPAVAPALIFVGLLMMAPLAKVQWTDITEAMPAFATVVFMVLGFGITEGVAMGCISFVLGKILAGRIREVHPIMGIIAIALAARYIWLR